MQLHLVSGSPNCRKVQAVAAELGIPLDLVEIDFQAGQHKQPDFLRLNPNGLVPVLVDGDFRLWESNAIMQYLADRSGDTPLFPHDRKTRASIVRWQFWETAHFGKHLGAVLFERIFKPLMGGEPDEQRAAEGLESFLPCAQTLDAQLKETGFVVGDRPTLADYSLACQLPHAALGRVDLSAYPGIGQWLRALDATEAWSSTTTPPPMLEALQAAVARVS
jgi:glutathione S-transferase